MDGITVRGVHIPEGDLQWRFTGAGGPGGQHANTANTAAELRFDLAASALPDRLKQRARRRLGNRLTDAGLVVVQASSHRSQTRNRDEARGRLTAILEEATAPPAAPRRPTRPTKGSQRRRLEGKKQRGQVKAARQRRDWD